MAAAERDASMPRALPVHLMALGVMIALSAFALHALGPALPPLNRDIGIALGVVFAGRWLGP